MKKHWYIYYIGTKFNWLKFLKYNASKRGGDSLNAMYDNYSKTQDLLSLDYGKVPDLKIDVLIVLFSSLVGSF